MIDTILTIIVNEHGVDEDCQLKLATTDKTSCLIGEYTVHSYQFGIDIPTGNEKLYKLTSNRLKDGQLRLQNFKIIFIDEYSMLRQK